MADLLPISSPLAAERQLDVVFVHGLGGDPITTWRSGSDVNTSWPHWLGWEFGPQIGVWTLGYAAASSKRLGLPFFRGKDPDAGAAMSLPRRAENALDRLVSSGIGQRPVCFITHSLGGLLVKSILRRSAESQSPERLQVVEQCRGVLFLATPHHGSRLADLADAIRVYLPSVSTLDLKDNDDHLMDLYEWYRGYASSHQILTRSYYENNQTMGVVIVVTRSSADPGVTGVTASGPTPLDRNHLEISKPRNPDDQAYLGSTQMIRQILSGETPGSAPEQTPTTSAPGATASSPALHSPPIPPASSSPAQTTQSPPTNQEPVTGNRNITITGLSAGGNVNVGNTIQGDYVAGDKFTGDKVMGDKFTGDKIVNTVAPSSPAPAAVPGAPALKPGVAGDRVEGDKITIVVGSPEQAGAFLNPPRWSWPTAWDFRSYREEKRQGFVGRSWLFEDVRAWALDTDPQAPQALLIAADYGVGKSAFLAELLASEAAGLPVLAHHFCTSEQEATLTPALFVRSLAAQLANALPAYRIALEADEAVEPRRWLDEAEQDPSRAFDQAILAPLLSIQPPTTSMLWVVDALDEAQELRAGMRPEAHITITQLLARYAGRLPRWIKVLATSRRRPDVLTPLRQAFSLKELNAEEARNLEDLYSYTLARCSKLPLAERLKQADLNAEEAARILSSEEQSSGKFLYVVRVLNDFASGQLPLHSREDLEQLPPGMEGFYRDAFERRFPTDESYEPVRNILGVLCEQREPLGRRELASILDVSELEILEWLKPMHDLLRLVSRPEEIDGQTRQTVLHSFDHVSLPQWLSEVDEWGYGMADRFLVNRATGAERIRSWAQKEVNAKKAHTWPYLVRHLAGHLNEEERPGVMAELLGEFAWLEARLRLTGINALLEDFTLATPSPWLSRLERTLRQGAHVFSHSDVWRGHGQLASQLLARLPPDDDETKSLREQALLWLNTAGGARPLMASLLVSEALLRTLSLESSNTALLALADGCLASGCTDGTIQLLDPASGTSHAICKGHQDSVDALALLPDGRLASGSFDTTIRLWDLASGTCIRVFEEHQGCVSALVPLPDGRLASKSWDKTIRVWDLTSGACSTICEIRMDLEGALVLLPDGHLACGSDDNSIRLWDLASGACPRSMEGHEDWVITLVLLADGRLASGSKDKTIRLWDLASGGCTRVLKGHQGPVTAMALLHDGRLASGSTDGTIRLWDLGSGAYSVLLEGRVVHALAQLSDGLLATGSFDTTIRLWDVANEVCSPAIKRHQGPVEALALLPDGRLASGSFDSTIRLWDLASGTCIRVFEGHQDPVDALVLLPDGRLASGSFDSTIRLWDLVSGSSTRVLEGHQDPVNALVLLPDGRLASGSFDTTIRLWDLASGSSTRVLEGHQGPVDALVLLPDSRLASGSWDKNIRLWDLANGACTHVFEGHQGSVDALALLPDGRLASGSSDKTIRLWDIASGASIHVLEGHQGSLKALALLPDGRLASGSTDCTIRLWDPSSPTSTPNVIFVADSAITTLVVHHSDCLLVAGDSSGCLHWLDLQGL